MRRAGIEPGEVDDMIIGAAAQQGAQSYNLGRLCAIAGGLRRRPELDRQARWAVGGGRAGSGGIAMDGPGGARGESVRQLIGLP